MTVRQTNASDFKAACRAIRVSNDKAEGATVAIVYRSLPQYRVAFYDGLRRLLQGHGVRLRLLVGQPDPSLAERRDTASVGWAETHTSRYLEFRGRQLVWQPVLRELRACDLVIVEQASKLLLNYPLVGWRRIGGPKLALWGHGQNLDVHAASPTAERLKRWLADQSDWWFCYTEGTARLVESFGVDRRKMTVVQNTTDTESLRRARQAMSAEDVATVRTELGIGDGPVAVSIGSIYPTKRPEFLLEAADHLRRISPGFELIVIGDGPDRHLLDTAMSSRPWLHVLGAIHGDDLARLASPASVLLNPGLVGLTIVDALALGLPMVTCDVPYHSPEVEYLKHGINGLMLAGDVTPERYAREVAGLLDDRNELAHLSCNAAEAAMRYTMDEMVERFADGILAALAAPRADARLPRRCPAIGSTNPLE